jgi:photosynthetic reaction center cytochrome c subunit
MRLLTGAGLLLVCALVCATARPTAQAQGQVQGQVQTQGQQKGQPPAGRGQALTNIQVLPKDWTFQQVVVFMRGFTTSLGVMCDHCHVGTMQERSKDDKPAKILARKMIKMTMAINDDYLKGVGDPAVAQKVTCYTCHHGATKPLTAAPSGGY